MADTTVYDFIQLRDALTNAAIDTIYLGADITYTAGQGITVNKTRNLVIDGTDPYSGIRYSITDNNTTSPTQLIYVPNSSPSTGFTITLQNLDFYGRNYYGMVHAEAGGNNVNTEVIYKNLVYSGPQAVYNISGACSVFDSTFTIGKLNGSICSTNEFCETNRLFLYGNVLIEQNTTTDALFWLYGTNPEFKVMQGAQVILKPALYLFYIDGGMMNTLFCEGSSTIIDVPNGLYRYNLNTSHISSDFIIEDNASLIVNQTARYSGVGGLRFRNLLSIGTNSTLYYAINASGTSPLIQSASNAHIQINDPKQVVLYNNNSVVFSFSSATLDIDAELVNYWTTPLTTTAAGTLNDIPQAHWHKKDYEQLVSINATCSSSATTAVTSNIGSDDIGGEMNTTTFNLMAARVLSFGRLYLNIDDITDRTAFVSGVADSNASLRLITPVQTTDFSAQADGSFSQALAGYLLKNQIILLKTNLPFLIKQLNMTVKGSLWLSFVPQRIEFKNVVIPSNLEFIKRRDPSWHMEVTDTRTQGNGWRLYATITHQMSADETINDALGIKHSTDFEPFSDNTSTVVFEGEFEEDKVTIVNWDELDGILLKLMPHFEYETGLYTTTIYWTLEEIS